METNQQVEQNEPSNFGFFIFFIFLVEDTLTFDCNRNYKMQARKTKIRTYMRLELSIVIAQKKSSK